jgi:hypothetical protein
MPPIRPGLRLARDAVCDVIIGGGSPSVADLDHRGYGRIYNVDHATVVGMDRGCDDSDNVGGSPIVWVQGTNAVPDRSIDWTVA